MFNIGFLWLALSIGSEITGTSMIKKTNNFKKFWPSLLVIAAYCLCYFALTQAMGYVPVGVAYSLWCGFGIVGVTIVSMLLYKLKTRPTRNLRHGTDYLRRYHHEYVFTYVAYNPSKNVCKAFLEHR